MYRLSLSEKVVIKVVMKGWPATAARVFLSLRMCSTCFRRMTADIRRGVLLSPLESLPVLLTVGLA